MIQVIVSFKSSVDSFIRAEDSIIFVLLKKLFCTLSCSCIKDDFSAMFGWISLLSL